MKLSKEEVIHIAKLARLRLSDEETDKFSKQLSDILSHAKMLDEVKTDNVEAISQITGLQNVLFPDKVNKCGFTDELLKQTPQQVQDHMIKVKSVF